MKISKWLGVGFIALTVGACSVNNQLATQDSTLSQGSSHYHNGKFHNDDIMEANGFGKMLGLIGRYITEEKKHAVPDQPLPMKAVSAEQLQALSNDRIHMVKLGHSSILLKVYGEFWLLDPVFSERASPFSFLGPKRFQQTPISIDELPEIDKVLISHNHYDHLDKASVKKLADKTKQFLVPLGVEADLSRWGVETSKVLSFDWWQELQTDNALVAFTPTKHFSGRALSDGNKSLWGSWVIKGTKESIYFSGDSGYFDGFKKIGDKYGPFDLTFIETGAYDKDWADIHMTPEQSLQAHLDLQGKVMVPVHNGTFDLAFHAWFEPLERVSKAADEHNAVIRTPITGEIFNSDKQFVQTFWWKPLLPNI